MAEVLRESEDMPDSPNIRRPSKSARNPKTESNLKKEKRFIWSSRLLGRRSRKHLQSDSSSIQSGTDDVKPLTVDNEEELAQEEEEQEMYPGHDMQPINYIRSLMATDGKTKAVGMEDYILKVFNIDNGKLHILIEGSEDTMVKYQKTYKIFVTIEKADLTKKIGDKTSIFGKLVLMKEKPPDPLPDIYLLKEKNGDLEVHDIEAKESCLKPEWQQTFTFAVESIKTGYVVLELWNKRENAKELNLLKNLKNNKDKPGDFIGKVSIPLSEITPNGESTSRQFDLKSHGGKTRGCIEVKLKVQAEIEDVSHDEALENYEKLFGHGHELSLDEDVSPDSTGQHNDHAHLEYLLHSYSESHRLTILEAIIIKLHVLMRFHQKGGKFAVPTSMFQSLYNRFVEEFYKAKELPDKKQMDRLSQCSTTLVGKIRQVVRKCHLDTTLENDHELQNLLLLLKSIFEEKHFLASSDPQETSLKKVVQREVKEGWVKYFEEIKLQPPTEIPIQSNIVREVCKGLKTAKLILTPVFEKMDQSFHYFEIVYVLTDKKILSCLEAVSDMDSYTTEEAYDLYLAIQDFKILLENHSKAFSEATQLSDFDHFFKGQLPVWMSYQGKTLKDQAQRAALFEETEFLDATVKFSSNARAFLDVIYNDVHYFWKTLKPFHSIDTFASLIEVISATAITFAKDSCEKINAQFMSLSDADDASSVRKMICVVIDDVYHVLVEVKKLPQSAQFRPNFEDLDDRAQSIIDEMEGTISSHLKDTYLKIASKMSSDVGRELEKLACAPEETFDEASSSLMKLLEETLVDYNKFLVNEIFIELLVYTWDMLMKGISPFVNKKRKEIHSQNFFYLLQRLDAFFKADGEGLFEDQLRTEEFQLMYNVFGLHMLSTRDVVLACCDELAIQQSKASDKDGSILVSATFWRKDKILEVRVECASERASVMKKKWQPYLKVGLMPRFLAESPRKKAVGGRKSPTLEESFFIDNVSEEALKTSGALVMIEIYSYNKVTSHKPLGMVVIKCKDVPINRRSTRDYEELLESQERLSVSLPVIAPICDSEVFAELKARKDDEESRCFLERIRRFTKVNIT